MTPEDHPPDTQEPITQVVRWIRLRNWAIAEFWSNAHGWAPPDASELLERSRLDLQVELSETLHLWVSDDPAAGPMRDGPLILAWSNLGALVEGTLKWFLSVFLDDYRASIQGLLKAHPEPDSLTLEPLRQFFAKHVWLAPGGWDAWIQLVQSRRNAIHSFRRRPLGSRAEFENSVRTYARFLADLDRSIPRP